MNVQLAQIAISGIMVVFIVAIVGAFTLFGVAVYQIHGKTKEK